MKLTDAQIASRVGQKETYTRYRNKIHRLRRLVAGDVSALENGGSSAQMVDMEHLYKGDGAELYDILVTDIEAGRSNKLLQTVRTFAYQVTLENPDFEFEDLSSVESIVNASYLKDRFRRTAATDEGTKALLDYLVGGVGCTFVGYREDYPCMDHIDSLDIVWDMAAPSFDRLRWAGFIVRRPYEEWEDMFGKKKVFQTMKGQDPDKPVSVMCYYDIQGDEGNLAYFLSSDADGNQITPENLIERVKNPYKISQGGQLVPTIPLEFMKYFNLPSVKCPLSVVEMMLPAQIALWDSDKRIREIVAANEPIWQYEEGTIESSDLEAWKDGEPGLAMPIKPGSKGLTVSPTIGVDQTLIEYRNANERELTGAGGANPYASGNPVKDVQYAAQVNAIQGAAGLSAAAIAKDVRTYWVNIARRMLAVGSQYDDQPLTVRTVDGNLQVEMVFDESDPVNQYLRPDAEVVVSEESMAFMPREQKIAMAAQDLQVAAGFAQMYPNLLAKSLEKYLRAQGVRDVASYLEQPQMQMMPMEDPAAMAMASTAA